jgi:hypothetical protein
MKYIVLILAFFLLVTSSYSFFTNSVLPDWIDYINLGIIILLLVHTFIKVPNNKTTK